MGLSAYRAMWLIAMFDLPVDTPKARKRYTKFRNSLLKDGFTMLQFSVYARFCASEDAAKVHRKRVREALPSEGQVRVMALTDRQFAKMEVYLGRKREKPEAPVTQLELF